MLGPGVKFVDTWGLAVKVVVFCAGGLVGGLLHEATHAATARALGGRVVDYGISYVEYEMSAETGVWRDSVINLSPALVGWAIGIGYYSIFGWPTLSISGLLGVGAWCLYTLNLSIEDLHPGVAHGESWWWRNLDDHAQLLIIGMAMTTVGTAGLLWPAYPLPGEVGTVIRYFGVAVAVAGGIISFTGIDARPADAKQ